MPRKGWFPKYISLNYTGCTLVLLEQVDMVIVNIHYSLTVEYTLYKATE